MDADAYCCSTGPAGAKLQSKALRALLSQTCLGTSLWCHRAGSFVVSVPPNALKLCSSATSTPTATVVVIWTISTGLVVQHNSKRGGDLLPHSVLPPAA